MQTTLCDVCRRPIDKFVYTFNYRIRKVYKQAYEAEPDITVELCNACFKRGITFINGKIKQERSKIK